MSLHMSCLFSCLFSSLLSHVSSHVLLILLSFLVCPLSSSRFFSFHLLVSSLLLSSLVFSCLVSCLSLSLSVSLCVCLSLSLCLSVCVVWCVWCPRVYVQKHLRVYVQNASVCRFKTSPCVPAPRPHVITHAGVVPVHTGTFRTYTRGRFECTHGGGRGEGRAGHRQFCLPKFAHVRLSLDPRGSPKKPLVLTHSRSENKSRTTHCRFLQSFALPDEPVHFQQS